MNATDEHGGYPLGASNETPVDLAAVQADDALLDMLGGAEVARGDADADLARVLVAWRRDVDAEPIGEPVDDFDAWFAAANGRFNRSLAASVDTDTALAAIRVARPLPLHARIAAAVRGFFHHLMGGDR